MPDRARIEQRLQALWEISLGPGGGAERPAYSSAEAEAMRLVAGWASDHGLAPALDDHGNLWAMPPGWTGPLVTSGSHVDTVPDGGRYDGALGTVLGLEMVADLGSATTARGARAALMVCAAEEAPRFGAGTLGSRLLAGSLAVHSLQALHDAEGVTAAQALSDYHELLSDLPRIAPPLERWHGHAEIHVAQRSELRTVGVVTAVASPRRFRIDVDGEAGHAGEVSMGERHDALTGAAEISLEIERAAIAEPSQSVATVGRIRVWPDAVSVIPGRARIELEMRSTDSGSLQRMERSLHDYAANVAERRGLQVSITLTRAGDPVTMDPGLIDAALDAAGRLGIPACATWSGAGHDSQHLSALVPALLVFVPLHDGQSHTPQEGADLEEIINAARLVSAVFAPS